MSAFEKIGTDRQLQDHWLRRLIAGVVDSIIIWVIAWVISPFLALPAILLGSASFFGTLPFLNGILFFLYASLFETSRGATIGKQIMNLRVTTAHGNVASLNATMIRNISKIYWVLWFIDTLLGMATVGNPYQKYSDRFAGTNIESTIVRPLILPSLIAFFNS